MVPTLHQAYQDLKRIMSNSKIPNKTFWAAHKGTEAQRGCYRGHAEVTAANSWKVWVSFNELFKFLFRNNHIVNWHSQLKSIKPPTTVGQCVRCVQKPIYRVLTRVCALCRFTKAWAVHVLGHCTKSFVCLWNNHTKQRWGGRRRPGSLMEWQQAPSRWG